ncbi:MAG: serine/threonine protein phosphatase PrpC [Polyangiales bacterium]
MELGLFAVADGMGGHNAGEVASSLALDTLRAEVMKVSPETPLTTCIAEAIVAASHAVAAEARVDSGKANMGTTLTALLVRDGRAAVGHVGGLAPLPSPLGQH